MAPLHACLLLSAQPENPRCTSRAFKLVPAQAVRLSSGANAYSTNRAAELSATSIAAEVASGSLTAPSVEERELPDFEPERLLDEPEPPVGDWYGGAVAIASGGVMNVVVSTAWQLHCVRRTKTS